MVNLQESHLGHNFCNFHSSSVKELVKMAPQCYKNEKIYCNGECDTCHSHLL